MQPGRTSVSVVVVTYNNATDIGDCLQSLGASTRGLDLDVVVVDNASSDGTADLVRELARTDPRIALVRSETNAGFGAACNLGAAGGSSDYIVLLNPDTTTHDEAVRNLLEVARRPGVGPVAGCTVSPAGHLDGLSAQRAPTLLQTFAWALATSSWLSRLPGRLGSTLGRNGALLPLAAFERERPVGVVIGCLLGIKRTDWELLGGFDETFFMYGEDVDLSLRAVAAGLTPTYTPAAVITHAVGASSASFGAKVQLVLAGRATVMSRHWTPARARAGQLLLVAGTALRSLIERAAGRRGPWTEAFAARESWQRGYPPRAADSVQTKGSAA